MRRKHAPYKASQFIGDCGTIIPLPRMYKQREKGHVKDLFCPKCGRVHGFREYKRNEFWKTMSGEVLG